MFVCLYQNAICCKLVVLHYGITSQGNTTNLVSLKPHVGVSSPSPACQPVVVFQATSSSGQVMSLEDALAQCKSEISVYIEQLNQTQDNFRRELAVKEDKVTVACCRKKGACNGAWLWFRCLLALLQSVFHTTGDEAGDRSETCQLLDRGRIETLRRSRERLERATQDVGGGGESDIWPGRKSAKLAGKGETTFCRHVQTQFHSSGFAQEACSNCHVMSCLENCLVAVPMGCYFTCELFRPATRARKPDNYPAPPRKFSKIYLVVRCNKLQSFAPRDAAYSSLSDPETRFSHFRMFAFYGSSFRGPRTKLPICWDVIEGWCYSVNILQTNELATRLPRFVKKRTSHDQPCQLFTLLLQTAMKKNTFYDAEVLCRYFEGRGLSGSRIQIWKFTFRFLLPFNYKNAFSKRFLKTEIHLSGERVWKLCFQGSFLRHGSCSPVSISCL